MHFELCQTYKLNCFSSIRLKLVNFEKFFKTVFQTYFRHALIFSRFFQVCGTCVLTVAAKATDIGGAVVVLPVLPVVFETATFG